MTSACMGRACCARANGSPHSGWRRFARVQMGRRNVAGVVCTRANESPQVAGVVCMGAIGLPQEVRANLHACKWVAGKEEQRHGLHSERAGARACLCEHYRLRHLHRIGYSRYGSYQNSYFLELRPQVCLPSWASRILPAEKINWDVLSTLPRMHMTRHDNRPSIFFSSQAQPQCEQARPICVAIAFNNHTRQWCFQKNH